MVRQVRRIRHFLSFRTQESRFPRILLISPIAEMQGEFESMLMIEMGTDNSSRMKQVA